MVSKAEETAIHVPIRRKKNGLTITTVQKKIIKIKTISFVKGQALDSLKRKVENIVTNRTIASQT